MIARLGHDAVVGCHRHQVEVDTRRARDHRADEALVAGGVDHRQLLSGGQVEARVAKLDRDAARALLRETIRVDSRQGTDQRCLAVVDVARRPERQGPIAHHTAARAAVAASSRSASLSVRGSRTT